MSQFYNYFSTSLQQILPPGAEVPRGGYMFPEHEYVRRSLLESYPVFTPQVEDILNVVSECAFYHTPRMQDDDVELAEEIQDPSVLQEYRSQALADPEFAEVLKRAEIYNSHTTHPLYDSMRLFHRLGAEYFTRERVLIICNPTTLEELVELHDGEKLSECHIRLKKATQLPLVAKFLGFGQGCERIIYQRGVDPEIIKKVESMTRYRHTPDWTPTVLVDSDHSWFTVFTRS